MAKTITAAPTIPPTTTPFLLLPDGAVALAIALVVVVLTPAAFTIAVFDGAAMGDATIVVAAATRDVVEAAGVPETLV